MSGAILWFTGLSGGGKSTLANAVGARLRRIRPVEILDGDEVRTHLSKGLGFTQGRSRHQRPPHRLRRAAARQARRLRHHRGDLPVRGDPRTRSGRSPPPRAFRSSRSSSTRRSSRWSSATSRGSTSGRWPARSRTSPASPIPYEPPAHPDVVIKTDAEPVEASVDRILAVLAGEGSCRRCSSAIASSRGGSRQKQHGKLTRYRTLRAQRSHADRRSARRDRIPPHRFSPRLGRQPRQPARHRHPVSAHASRASDRPARFWRRAGRRRPTGTRSTTPIWCRQYVLEHARRPGRARRPFVRRPGRVRLAARRLPQIAGLVLMARARDCRQRGCSRARLRRIGDPAPCGGC